MKELYDWVPWFTELAKSIADGEPSDLAGRARQLAWKTDGATSPLLKYGDSNIDPFSFLYTLATSCTKNHRKLLCESVQNEFALSTPLPEDSDDAFIFPQGILLKTLFHHDGDGNPDLLWRLFRAACQSGASVHDDDFRSALAIKGVGLPMLTQTLFLANPQSCPTRSEPEREAGFQREVSLKGRDLGSSEDDRDTSDRADQDIGGGSGLR